MLGFMVVGTVCAVALVRSMRRCAHFRGGFGYGGPGCGPGLHGVGRSRFGGRHWLLRSILERLETTPGQEKVILGALRELDENRSAVADEMKRTRSELAGIVAGGLVDDASMEEAFARHDRLVARLRVSFVEALKKITEALDEHQRKELGAMLEGGWMRRWGAPYRGVWV